MPVQACDLIATDRGLSSMFVNDLYEAVKAGYQSPTLDVPPIRFGSAHHAGVHYLRHLFMRPSSWVVPWRINNLVKYLAQVCEWEAGYYAEFTDDDAWYVRTQILPQVIDWVQEHLVTAYHDASRPFASPDVLRERGKNVASKYFHKVALSRWPDGCYEHDYRIMMTVLPVSMANHILSPNTPVRRAPDYAIHVPNQRRHNMGILHDVLLRNNEYLFLGRDLEQPTVHVVIPIPEGTIHRAEWCFCKVPTSTVNYREVLTLLPSMNEKE